ncbi:MAG: hypothetical protein ACE5FD_18175, partial [Anaerolineae bacterium]
GARQHRYVQVEAHLVADEHVGAIHRGTETYLGRGPMGGKRYGGDEEKIAHRYDRSLKSQIKRVCDKMRRCVRGGVA